MATKKAAKKAVKPGKPARAAEHEPVASGKQMIKWDEELAKYADKSEAQEDTAVGGSGMKYFSLKSGVLSFDEAVMPHNKVPVVILDSIFEHAYYEGRYDPESPSPPTCFALGRDEGELVPHKDVIERGQNPHDACEGCPMNEFGSADTGRGKACKNVRRLAMIPAGKFAKNGAFTMIEDEEHYAEAGLAFMRVPVTSTPAYKAYVKSLAANLRKPTFAVVTEISLVPDPKNQFAVKFEALDELPVELLDTVFKRVQEASAIIETPLNLDEREERPQRNQRAQKPTKPGRAVKKTTAAQRGGKKY